jgi:hypothetical protein
LNWNERYQRVRICADIGRQSSYRNLDKFDDSRPLEPWLFQIAHNRCIDFLRKRKVCEKAEEAATFPKTVRPLDPSTVNLSGSTERICFLNFYRLAPATWPAKSPRGVSILKIDTPTLPISNFITSAQIVCISMNMREPNLNRHLAAVVRHLRV